MIENMKNLIVEQKSALLAKKEEQDNLSDSYFGIESYEELINSLEIILGINHSITLIDEVLEILDSKLLLETYHVVRAQRVVFNAVLDKKRFSAPSGAYKIFETNAKILSETLFSDDFMSSIRE